MAQTPAASSNPSTMKAWAFTSRGPPTNDRLKLITLPRPTAKNLRSDEVLIKIQYVGIWPRYSHTLMPSMPHLTSSPWFPEMDFSGTIEALGSSVSTPVISISDGDEQDDQLKVGDEVFGTQDPATHLRYGGVARQYMCLPAKLVIKPPKSDNGNAGIDLKTLAALGGNACAAAQFMDVLGLKGSEQLQQQPPKKVLVTGASGALGTMVIPILRATLGKTGIIVGVCSTSKMDMVKRLGADEVIDYKTTPDLPTYLEKYHSSPKSTTTSSSSSSPPPSNVSTTRTKIQFDIIIDITGHDDSLHTKCPTYLAPTGTYLFAGNISSDFLPHPPTLLQIFVSILRVQIKLLTPRVLGGVPRKTLFHPAKIDQNCLRQVSELVGRGVLKPTVGKVWEFGELMDLYEFLKVDGGFGKHVLRVG